MKFSKKRMAGIIAVLGVGVAAGLAIAHPGGMGPEAMGMGPMGMGMGHGAMHRGMGPGMMHGMGSGAARESHGPMGGAMHGSMGAGMQHDEAFAADMHLVRDLIHNHDRIERTVTNLPNGIRTVTESDDPQVAQVIKAHVASMEQRLKDGRVFNLFSRTLPTLFENKDKIKTQVETTEKGAIVTQVSSDSKVVAALQGHAVEVSELARDGMVAMLRGMRANMAMMHQRGPRAGVVPNAAPTAPQAPASSEHAH